MSEPSSDPFIERLGKLDRGAQAALRRSLAFAPGTWPAVFPYVEPFVRGQSRWKRAVAYLVAGLMASSKASSASGNLGDAAFVLRVRTDSRSVESRFVALLDADEEQLPHRLRQMITLMAGHDIAPDWALLRRDLERWMHDERYIQQRWAERYYAQDAEPKEADSSDEAALSDAEGAGTEI